MHIHTCPGCEALFESAMPGHESLCDDCWGGTPFDDDSPTNVIRERLPLGLPDRVKAARSLAHNA